LYAGWILIAGFVSLATAACSSGTTDTVGTPTNEAGTSGTSGASGASGASGTSGTTGTTGTSSGSPEDGGIEDAPVTTGPTTTYLYTFNDPDAGLEGWNFNTYQTTSDTNDADGIDPNNLSMQTALSWDDNDGTNPMPPLGEMTVTIPFSAYNQKADFVQNSLPLAAMDLTNKVITLWMKIDRAADGGVAFSPSLSAPGGIVIYIKTGIKFIYASAKYANIDPTKNGWTEYTFDLNEIDTPSDPNLDAGFDPTDVVSIGFYIHSGGGGTPLADGGSMYPNPSPATFHIDSIGLIPSQ
jgi:hypothetical protein